MRAERRYLMALVACITGIVIAVGLVNFIVDPFGVYGAVEVEGFNANKPWVLGHEHLHRAYAVRRIRPEGVILGSSRAQTGLDPNHPGWKKGVTRTYNIGLPAANMYEILRYFEHANNIQPVKEAVIGLDFFSFSINNSNKAAFDEMRLSLPRSGVQQIYGAFSDIPSTLFTFESLEATATTVLKQSSPRTETPLGLRTGEYFKTVSSRLRPGYRSLFVNGEQPFVEIPQLLGAYRLYDSSGRSPSLDDFRTFIAEARKNRVDLRLFISPSHARQWEIIRAMGLWPTFEQWKRELVRILAEDAAAHPGESPYVLWDFSGYNAFTTEDVPPEGDATTQMRWYWDNSHFKKELGDIVLDKVFGYRDSTRTDPPDFGVVLSPLNIEAEFARVRLEQERYHQSHPRDVLEIADMVRAVQSKPSAKPRGLNDSP